LFSIVSKRPVDEKPEGKERMKKSSNTIAGYKFIFYIVYQGEVAYANVA